MSNNKQNIWFTSDSHFGHKSAAFRRGYKDVDEHDEDLVKVWNLVVSKRDIVYHLGDVALCKPTRLLDILNKLNGNIHLIRGNHDSTALNKVCRDRFSFIKDTYMFKRVVPDGNSYLLSARSKTYLGIENSLIWLSHYAHRVWPQRHYGATHLFGHSHGNLPPHGKSFDCGVDTNFMLPYQFEDVLLKFHELDEYNPDDIVDGAENERK